jgi:UDP-2,3-diacylglucosamine pyrophosphatase LpxH
MAIFDKAVAPGVLPLRHSGLLREDLIALVQRRISRVYEQAEEVLFDDSSRLVFFSDCHRGDHSRADAFSRNERLFLHALSGYYERGFTYVEVGDGDELWQNRRFSDIRKAHARTFDLLHRFDERRRLHLILGNHDVQGIWHSPADKDGLSACEGLILRHVKTGQRILVLHGHQADLTSDRLCLVSQFVVRYIWKRLLLLGCASAMTWLRDLERDGIGSQLDRWLRVQQHKIELKITSWIQDHQQMVICGHTHRPQWARYGATPYFNTGSCIRPGFITGLEIENGHITPVRWMGLAADAKGLFSAQRECVGSPLALRAFAL